MKTVKLDWTKENPELERTVIDTAEKALKIMLEKGLTRVLERKAVYLTLRKDGNKEKFIRVKIGTTFPDGSFELGCKEFSLEKTIRTEKYGHSCSMASRNPKKDE